MQKKDFEKIKDSLQQVAGIHRKEEYFNGVVLVLLMPINDVYHLVFEKRSPSIRQGGEVCFPGGKIDEEDTTLERTAFRETYEELGISKEHIQLIGRLDTIVNPVGTTIDAFVGITDVSLDEMHLNPDEVSYVITVPLSYFLEHTPERYSTKVKMHPSYIDEETGNEVMLLPSEVLGLPERYKMPWGDFNYDVLLYNVQGEMIWGITARLISDLVNQINKQK